jgi:ABC-type enterochelin transport system permease subunit
MERMDHQDCHSFIDVLTISQLIISQRMKGTKALELPPKHLNLSRFLFQASTITNVQLLSPSVYGKA